MKSAGRSAVAELLETVRFLAGVAVVWLALVTFAFAAFHIPSESMQPKLQVGDRVLVTKFTYGYSRHSLPLGLGYFVPETVSGRLFGFAKPARGDVVVVRDPGQRLNLIKRVIGLPGDTIALREGRLYINGALVEREPVDIVRYRDRQGLEVQAMEYVETLPGGRSHPIYERSDRAPLDNAGPYRVPADHVFLMGDNRDASADSRVAVGPGYVHLDEVVGRAETVLFTFARCRDEEGLHCPGWRVWRGL